MRWGFAAGQLLLEDDPRSMLAEAAASFDHWEVTGEGRWQSGAALRRVADLLDGLDLSLTVHGRFRKVDLAADGGAADAIQEQIDAAADLGAAAVVVHPGRVDSGAWQRSRRALGRLGEQGRDRGVEVRVENMPFGRGELGQTPEELAGLVEGTTGAACLDLGHLHTLQAAPDLGALDPYVRELHVHANDGLGDQHEPVDGTATWIAPWLQRYEDRDVLAVVEHRHVAECVASARAARDLAGLTA